MGCLVFDCEAEGPGPRKRWGFRYGLVEINL